MFPLCPSSILTGPEKSPRWGLALFIDLGTPDSTLAISRENRLPRASVVVTLAAQELMRLSKGGEKVENIVVRGSEIDPTLHPGFKEITENLRELRNKWFPRAKLCLESDEPHLETREARLGVAAYDRPVIRLESGTAKTFARQTGRKSSQLGEIVHHLTHIERVIIRAHFVRGEVDNSTPNEVKGWIKRLRDVRPNEVQISSPNPRGGRNLPRGVTKTRLREIVEEVSDTVGATVTLLDPADEPA